MVETLGAYAQGFFYAWNNHIYGIIAHMKIIVLIIFILILLVVITSAVDNNRFITSEYSVSSPKVERNCRIAFLSDLHGNMHGKDNVKLIQAVKNSDPDIIVMGGDMITSRAGEVDKGKMQIPISLAEAFGDRLVFYGMGNHEFRMYLYREDFGNSFDELKKELESRGVHFLRNDRSVLDDMNIEIQGLEIERKFYRRGRKITMESSDLRKLIPQRDEKRYRILLAHNPEFFEAYSHEADLVLSGHFHGGIVRLPLIGGLVSARLSLFPKYDGGIYELNGSKMIVSRGLGSHTIPLRVFNPCELCIIDIRKE